jgi:hypothetical protein
VASAQMADQAEVESMKKDYLGLKPAGKAFSLIDLSKLEWTHSYSFTFFSGGGSSGTFGLYTGNLFYEITPNLTLNLKLGLAHNPSDLFGEKSLEDATFLPGVHLNYRPSNKVSISAGFDTIVGSGYYLYNPYYYNPYYWRR